MNKSQQAAQASILKAVDNQIRDNNPPEVKQTYQRLRASGITDLDARKYIGCALTEEMTNILNKNELYNSERYLRNLAKLPVLPWE
jgi:hypothetical protein